MAAFWKQAAKKGENENELLPRENSQQELAYSPPLRSSASVKDKKMSSFISSPTGVDGLSSPFIFASTSLNFSIIAITFTPV